MTSTLNIALLQMDVKIGDPEQNFTKCEHMLKEALSHEIKPDVIILPELWNTGFALEQIHDLADIDGERTKQFFSSFSQKHQVNIIAGSIAEKQAGNVKNTTYVFDRSGQLVADYSKIHLFRLMDEEKYLTEGSKRSTVNLEGVDSGLMICYDTRFPELARSLALEGAKVLYVPAQWPKPRLNHWRTLLIARAIENQMFVVACNRVGTSGNAEFFGNSMVIDPWGEVLVEGGEEEGILRASINIEQVDEVRRKIPIFEDRRTSLYTTDQ